MKVSVYIALTSSKKVASENRSAVEEFSITKLFFLFWNAVSQKLPKTAINFFYLKLRTLDSP